jgi:hypothetical protein
VHGYDDSANEAGFDFKRSSAYKSDVIEIMDAFRFFSIESLLRQSGTVILDETAPRASSIGLEGSVSVT